MFQQPSKSKTTVFLFAILFPVVILSTPVAAPEVPTITDHLPPVIVTITPSNAVDIQTQPAKSLEEAKSKTTIVTISKTATTPDQETKVPPAPVVSPTSPEPTLALGVAISPKNGSIILNDKSYDQSNFKAQMLLATNFFRSQHSAPELKWNDSLAKQSTDWVAGCHFAHSGLKGAGENIAAGPDSVAKTIDGWALERTVYNFDTGNPFSPQNVTGHFTQLVWKETSSVGCAVKACSKYDNLPAQYGKWFVTCRYAPAGNVVGDNQAYYIKNVAKFKGDLAKGIVAASS